MVGRAGWGVGVWAGEKAPPPLSQQGAGTLSGQPAGEGRRRASPPSPPPPRTPGQGVGAGAHRPQEGGETGGSVTQWAASALADSALQSNHD